MTDVSKLATPPLLTLSGEMGSLIKQYNWATTALGAMDTWPAALRNTLSTITAAPLPMGLFWGKDYITFYNDALIPSWGTEGKHPGILGKPLEATFAESLEFVKPLFDAVFFERKSCRFEDQLVPIHRNGKLDNVYWTFTYSPVFDDAGNVGGVLVVCTETTSKVLTIIEKEAQFRTLSQHSPDVVVQIDNDRKYLYASPAFEQLTGIPPAQIIGKSYWDLDLPPQLCRFFDEHLDVVCRTKKPHAVEYPSHDNTAYINTRIIPEMDDAGNIHSLISISTDITARKRGEDELQQAVARQRETLALLESLLLHAPVGLAFLDKDHRFVRLNEAMAALNGIPQQTHIGKTLAELFPENAPYVAPYLEHVLTTGKAVVDVEIAGYTPKEPGVLRYWLASYYPVFDAETAEVKFVGAVVAEITERKRAEQALLLEQTFNENILEASPALTYIFDITSGTNAFVSNQITDILGYSEGEVNAMGSRLLEILLHPDDVAVAGQRFEKIIAGDDNRVFEMEYRMHHKDGHWVWLFDRARVFKRTNGVPTQILGVANDISANKRKEAQLVESEEKMRLFIDHAPAAVAMLGKEMQYLAVSHRWLQDYNITGDVIGLSHYQAFPDMPGKWKEIHQLALAGSIEKSDEDCYVREDGVTIWLKWEVRPWYGSDGEIGGIVVFSEDITERKKAEQALQQSEAQFRSLVEQSPIATCLFVGRELKIALANEMMLRSWGKTASVITQPLAKALPEMEGQPFLDIMDKVFTTGQRYDGVETPAQLEVGGVLQTFYFNFILKPLFDGEGKVYAILNTAVDVTEQVRARESLAESEKKYRHLIETNLSGVLFWDLDKGIVDANDAFLNMIGYTRHELEKGLHWKTMTPEKWQKKDEDSIAELLATGKNTPFEKQYVHKDGHPVDVIISNSALAGTGNRRGVTFVVDISEQKRTEAAIRESESRFRSTASDAPAFIFMANADAQIEYINNTWLRFAGFSDETGLGHAWADITHPDDVQPSFDIFNQAFEARTSYQYEMRQKGIDGRYHDILWRGVPRFLPNGEFVGMLGFGFDITDRKQSEIALKESEEQFRNFSNNIQNLAWIAQGDGWIYWYNQRWYDYTGTTLEEMQGWGWEIVHHPDHIDRVVAYVKEAWHRPQPFELLFPLRGRDGLFRWFLTRCVPIVGQDGRPIKWIGTNTDINEQFELQKALEQSEQQLKLVADFMPQMVWATTPEGYHDFFNQRWYDFTGHTVEQSKGEGWSSVLHPDDRERTEAVWTRSLQTGAYYEIEYQMKRADGEYRWLLARAIPFKNEAGEITRWFGTLTDVHEQKLAAELLETKVKERTKELEDANTTLLQLNEELTQFTYITSHDLQEPLRKIAVFTQLIEQSDSAQLSEGARQNFEKINKSVVRMRHSLRDLLNYSTLDREAAFVQVDLNEILEGVLEDLEISIKESGASIRSEPLPVLKAIPVQMQQLFSNVVNNALKYAKSGVPPIIHITAKPLANLTGSTGLRLPLLKDKPYVEIVVSDNGIGFAAQHAEKIFMLFRRLHNRNQYSGTGIGLAICKKVVTRHRGYIYAEGQVGEGARLHIILPQE